MKLDFSGVEEFVPVAVGRYLAEIERSSEGLAQRSNKRKWSLQLVVVEQPEGMKDEKGEDVDYVGKTIKWDISLLPQALWKVMQTIQALGEDVTKDDSAFEFDATEYVGRRCVMIVTEQSDPTFGLRTRVSRLDHVASWEEAVAA